MTSRLDVWCGVVTVIFALAAPIVAPAPVGAQAPGPQPAPRPAAPPVQIQTAPQQPATRPSSPPANVPAPVAQAIKLEQLTKQRFDALPNDSVIDVKGQRFTKAQIKAKMDQQRAKARAVVDASQARRQFEVVRAEFLRKQKADLEARNAKVRAEVEKFAATPVAPSSGATLRKEATELIERSKTASPAEREKFERRAEELHRQLQQLGR